jgi:hypothetical protein
MKHKRRKSTDTLIEGNKPLFSALNLICKDCGEPFILTGGEREFYFKNELAQPLRCSQCRAKRKVTAQGVENE